MSRNNSLSRRQAKNPASPEPGAESLAGVATWPWWLHPFLIVIFTGVGSAALAFALGEGIYREWGADKYLSQSMLVTIAIGLSSLLAGILLGSRGALPGATHFLLSRTDVKALTSAFTLLLLLTVLGYTFWLLSALANGVTLSDLSLVLSRELGAISALKRMAPPIGGLTTLTQFGPMAAAVGFLLWRTHSRGPLFLVVVALAGVRTVFYAERLALIEVLIPIAIIWIVLELSGKVSKFWVAILPMIGVVTFLALFAVSEYYRSWIFYESRTDRGFIEWILHRVLAYYGTAYNNSALLALNYPSDSPTPYFSIPALWSAPGMGAVLGAPVMAGQSPDDWWTGTLAAANPEFNNKGSFLIVETELGVAWSVLYWVVIGVAIGWLYFRARRGALIGLLGYSVTTIGLLEVPRILYYGEGRFIPVLASIVLLGIYLAPKELRPDNSRGRHSDANSDDVSAQPSID